MTIDSNAIAAALAGKYSALTPPSGEQAIREATHEPPQNIPMTPFVLVSRSDNAEFTYGVQLRSGHIPFEVMFALEKSADLARQMVRLQKWEFVLIDATLVGVQLGLADHPGHIANTWCHSSELGDIEYGGQRWAGVMLGITVQTSDGITPTA